MASEYFTRSARLPEGPGSVTVDTIAAASIAGRVRKREDVTQRARNMLASMGL
jgi:hypothetical protein